MTADPARGKPSAATGGAEIDDMPHAVLSAGAGEVVPDQVEVVEARLRQPCRRHHRVNEVDADVRSLECVLRGPQIEKVAHPPRDALRRGLTCDASSKRDYAVTLGEREDQRASDEAARPGDGDSKTLAHRSASANDASCTSPSQNAEYRRPRRSPEKMSNLRPGEAFIWSSKATDEAFTKGAVKIRCRPRATHHGGATTTAVDG